MPSLMQVRLTISPSLTVVFTGGRMITGALGTVAVKKEHDYSNIATLTSLIPRPCSQKRGGGVTWGRG